MRASERSVTRACQELEAPARLSMWSITSLVVFTSTTQPSSVTNWVHRSGIGCGLATAAPAAHIHPTTDTANPESTATRRRKHTPKMTIHESPCKGQPQAPRLAWPFIQYGEQSHNRTGSSTRTPAGKEQQS